MDYSFCMLTILLDNNTTQSKVGSPYISLATLSGLSSPLTLYFSKTVRS